MQQANHQQIIVEADFLGDHRASVIWPMAARHGVTSRPKTPEEWFRLERDLHWLDHRCISRRKRKIRVATGFKCPDQVRAGLRRIRRKVLAGEDLNPHLSRGILNLTAQDELFTHWGIHHFHLGSRPDPRHPTLVEGTKELLFAWVTDEAVHHIAVKDHDAWTDRELLQILYNNWPELLKPFLMPHALASAPDNSTPQELSAARRCLMMPVQIDGQMYMPLGGGVTTAGTSVSATMQASRWRRQILHFEEWAKANAPAILLEHGHEVRSPLQLRLVYRDGRPYAVSTQHQFGIPMA